MIQICLSQAVETSLRQSPRPLIAYESRSPEIRPVAILTLGFHPGFPPKKENTEAAHALFVQLGTPSAPTSPLAPLEPVPKRKTKTKARARQTAPRPGIGRRPAAAARWAGAPRGWRRRRHATRPRAEEASARYSAAQDGRAWGERKSGTTPRVLVGWSRGSLAQGVKRVEPGHKTPLCVQVDIAQLFGGSRKAETNT